MAGICDELTMPYTKLPRRCLSIHLLCISTQAHYLFMMEHKINCLLFQSMFKRKPLRIKVPHIGDNYHCIPKKCWRCFAIEYHKDSSSFSIPISKPPSSHPHPRTSLESPMLNSGKTGHVCTCGIKCWKG